MRHTTHVRTLGSISHVDLVYISTLSGQTMAGSVLPSVTRMVTLTGVSTVCLPVLYVSSRHVVKEVPRVRFQWIAQSLVTRVLAHTNTLKFTIHVIAVGFNTFKQLDVRYANDYWLLQHYLNSL